MIKEAWICKGACPFREGEVCEHEIKTRIAQLENMKKTFDSLHSQEIIDGKITSLMWVLELY